MAAVGEALLRGGLLAPGDEGHPRSLGPYLEMLERTGVADRDEVLRAMPEPGGRSHDQVRHVLKLHFRPRVQDRMFEGDAVQSHRRLMETVEGLNGSDAGALSEAWYVRYEVEYEGGGGQEVHPELPVAGRAKPRRPDFVRGSTAGEVKSTSERMAARDVEQGEDLLRAAQRGEEVWVRREPRKLDTVEYVFTDWRGFVGSEEVLMGWMDEFGDVLSIKVFVDGRPVVAKDIDELRDLLGRLR